MNEEYQAEAQNSSGDETPQSIVYRSDISKQPWFYDNAPMISVVLFALAATLLCVVLILDSNLVSKMCGVIAAIAFLLYVGRYVYHFFKSRKTVTKEARLENDRLTVICDAWTKSYDLDEIVFTMSYSSSTNLCIVVATEKDYLTMNCSCGFLISKDGLQVLRPFYALNKAMMELNPNHVNYVKNKRYRRKNPYKVPLYVFEVEYDTPRAAKFIQDLRDKYRFDQNAKMEGEETA